MALAFALSNLPVDAVRSTNQLAEDTRAAFEGKEKAGDILMDFVIFSDLVCFRSIEILHVFLSLHDMMDDFG